MKTVIISDATHELIRAASLRGLKQGAKRLPDGRWEIELEEETLARVDELRLPGESDDDCISRALRNALKMKPN